MTQTENTTKSNSGQTLSDGEDTAPLLAETEDSTSEDLLDDESGQAMVEYVIMSAFLITFLLWMLFGFPEAISRFYDTTAFVIALPIF